MSALRERLADLAHRQWTGWMQYLFDKSQVNEDGSVTIPVELVHRWQRQMRTLYVQLPPNEQESDRVEADRVLGIIEPLLADACDELVRAERIHAPLNSAHEAYAVIKEELDEFWAEVRKKQAERDSVAMYRELVQIAAMCARTARNLRLD